MGPSLRLDCLETTPTKRSEVRLAKVTCSGGHVQDACHCTGTLSSLIDLISIYTCTVEPIALNNTFGTTNYISLQRSLEERSLTQYENKNIDFQFHTNMYFSFYTM